MRTKPLVALCATFMIFAACASGSDAGDTFNTFNDGIGDADDSETGDGDPSTGDGDGDPTGDGDGAPTGDGDGDPTGDGDGDGDGNIPIQPGNMIDNFEDGDGALLPDNGRQGYWYIFNDGTPGGAQTPPGDGVLPVSGGASGTSMAMRTTGNGFAEWGAGIGVDLNNAGDPEGGNGVKMIYDASGYTGIVLMAKGNGQIWASVQIEATIPPSEGGTCALDCDPHGKVLLLSNEWQQFTLPFNQLNQEGWGTPAAWNAAKVVGIQFKVAKDVNFDFWIDEIGFY